MQQYKKIEALLKRANTKTNLQKQETNIPRSQFLQSALPEDTCSPSTPWQGGMVVVAGTGSDHSLLAA